MFFFAALMYEPIDPVTSIVNEVELLLGATRGSPA